MGEHRKNEMNLKENEFKEQDPIYNEYLKVDGGYKIIFVFLKSSFNFKYYKRSEKLLLIENGEFQEFSYVLDHQKYFGKQNFEMKYATSCDAQRKGLAYFDLCKKKKKLVLFFILVILVKI